MEASTMKFKIDNFYYDNVYKVVQFKGYSDKGWLLFDRWEKSFVTSGPQSGWKPIGQRVNLDPVFQSKRNVRPILPPE